jgi:hypothetical protein
MIMKKKAILFAIAIALAVTAGNIFAGQSAVAQQEVTQQNKASVKTLYYWYYDLDFTDPVGSYSDVSTELSRLRDLHPGYEFSLIPHGLLIGFEFGYNPWNLTPIIFSNFHY